MHLPAVVPKWEIWREPASFDGVTTFDAFRLEDNARIDMLQCFGHDQVERSSICEWTLQRSDADGCIDLADSRPAIPNVQLDNERVPSLCLLDALTSQGFEGVDRKVTHQVGPP